MTTSKQGFTNGPWYVVEHSWSETSVVGPDGTICTISIYDEATEENQADLERRTAERARLIASAPELYEALAELLKHADRSECHHVATHRAGAIWTICDDCGRKWADDEGGFVPYVEPERIAKARAALARAAGEGE